jgi:hypothetical protein
MDNEVLRIEKCANGFEIEICDPEIRSKNSAGKGEYECPWVGYIFTTVEEVAAFIAAHLGSLEPEPDEEEEYGAEFARQASKADGEEEKE